MALQDNNIETLIRSSSESIHQFIEKFYHAYDNERQLLGAYYNDESSMIWNGNSLNGAAAISEFYARMPPTKHSISSLNCHPLPTSKLMHGSGTTLTKDTLIALVNGYVYYGLAAIHGDGGSQNSRHSFTHQFILRADTTPYRIVREVIRFV
jgi:hypothetical protein